MPLASLRANPNAARIAFPLFRSAVLTEPSLVAFFEKNYTINKKPLTFAS